MSYYDGLRTREEIWGVGERHLSGTEAVAASMGSDAATMRSFWRLLRKCQAEGWYTQLAVPTDID